MPPLFSAEANVSGYKPVGPEATANAGSPHAASLGTGAARAGQYTQVSPLNAGGSSFLQKFQFPQPPEDKGPQGPQGRHAKTGPNAPALGKHAAGAPGASPGNQAPGANTQAPGATTGWTANVPNSNAPSAGFGGAAYNNGGGPLANRISGTASGPQQAP